MIIYKERANGRWEFWTYADGQRIYLSETTAKRELSKGGKIINV